MDASGHFQRSRVMERLMELETEVFEKQAMERARAAVRQLGKAVNGGGNGEGVDRSAMEDKGSGEHLIRELFTMAVQSRIDSTESTFPPFGRRGSQANAKQGQAGAQ